MNLTKFLIAFVLVVFSFLGDLEAQEKQPLVDLISDLETRFDVKFSYSVDVVNNIFVEIPEKNETLKSIISTLNETTVLNFKFLNERYITVSTIDKTVTICGVLISETDNQPLFGASVLVANSSKGIITDSDGAFRLTEVPINEHVIISYLGFKTQSIKAKELLFLNDDCKTLILEEKREALSQILISKYLTTGLQKQIDGSTVLNTEKFGILPGLTEPDILQSIQALPGVESVNESIANINLIIFMIVLY